jgi:glutamyl-tRNA synthetase
MLRFAPSPTGDMHIGTLRLAILNYLIAQQKKESFLVRIEDTDTQHVIEGNDTEIMQILEKFALIHESVFHQSEHLHMHQTMAIKLLEQNKAFVCTCTKEELEADKAKANANNVTYSYSGKCENKDKAERLKLKESGTPFVLRIKKPNHDIIYNDSIQGNITTSPDEVDAFVILREDGTPSENFASVCDDMLSGITMVIRENNHLLDTAKQIHIKEQLGFDAEIQYAHVPIIHTSNQTEDILVKWLFAQGYIPDAIINYMLLLGNTQTKQEIFTLPEAIEWFNFKDISSSETIFDIDKLRFINREHLKRMDDKLLSSLFGFADTDVGKLVKLYLSEASTINELALRIRPIFAPKNFEGKWSKQMRTMETIIQDAPMFAKFSEFQAYVMTKSGLTDENFLKPLRLLLTGAEHGPELSDIYPHIKSYLLEIAS